MSPAVVTLLEVVVIVGVVCFFLFLIGRYIYRKKKGLPTGDCAMCHKSSKKLLKELKWDVKDVLEMEVCGDEIRIRKPFVHKTLEERIADYDGQIEVCDFEWGDPAGKEML